jgi:putative DNA primase/helicase
MKEDANDIMRREGPAGVRRWADTAKLYKNGKLCDDQSENPAARVEGEPAEPEPKTVSPIRIEPGNLHEAATEAEATLVAANVPFYVRGPLIVRPIIEECDAAHGHKTKTARLKEVSADCMVDNLSRVGRYERRDMRSGKFVRIDPPRSVAATILSRDGEWTLQQLAGIITTPTMRPDGSILDKPGYDKATKLLLLNPPQTKIDDKPTREDALAALDLLKKLLVEFPFADGGSRSVALSGIITPIVRGAMPVAPLHAMRAPAPGSGKSYLVDIFSAAAQGDRCPVMAAGRTEEETEKRLGAALLAGQPIISIDNLNGELGGDALCQLIERPRVAVRILGKSELVKIDVRTTVFATGNNMQPTGDVVRRVIMSTLDANLERPELRTFSGDPLKTVLGNRGAYISAVLTIVKAWLLSGEKPLAPLASFEAWSNTVRSALVWLGEEDPIATMETAREEDTELSMLRTLVAAWCDEIKEPKTTGELKAIAEKRDVVSDGEAFSKYERGDFVHPELHQALLDVAGRGGEIDTKRLGQYLKRNQHRIVDGIKIKSDYSTDSKQNRWFLERISPR